jgi:hypothetical protein
MSEKIYALLVRLYPSHFREAYGEAALQLFRDRARDEKGFFSRVRLWFDLLTDLAISVPRGITIFMGRSLQLPLGPVWKACLHYSFWKTSRRVPARCFLEAC